MIIWAKEERPEGFKRQVDLVNSFFPGLLEPNGLVKAQRGLKLLFQNRAEFEL